MSKEVRQGLGLLAIAVLCLLLGLVAEGQFGVVMRGAGFLFGVGGLVLVAIGLLRSP